MTPVKVGFVLLSNSHDPLPSTRISVLNMLAPLRAAHFDPHIVVDPATSDELPQIPDIAARLAYEGYRVVFFQKVHGPSVERLARRLRAYGVKTVYGVCDLVEPAMVAATDLTVAVTTYLKSCYPPELQPKIHVVIDGIERADARKAAWRDDRGSRRTPLHAALVTSSCLSHLPVIGQPPEWLRTWVIGNYPPRWRAIQRLKQMRWQMLQQGRDQRIDHVRFMLNGRIERVPWDPQGVYDRLTAADIGIIPVDADDDANASDAASWKVKSENRLTMKMAIGLPVVATPIPAYEAVIEHGVNGFLASSRADWQRALDALRDPQLRREMGERARASVVHRFSMAEQSRQLASVLGTLVPASSPAAAV